MAVSYRRLWHSKYERAFLEQLDLLCGKLARYPAKKEIYYEKALLPLCKGCEANDAVSLYLMGRFVENAVRKRHEHFLCRGTLAASMNYELKLFGNKPKKLVMGDSNREYPFFHPTRVSSSELFLKAARAGSIPGVLWLAWRCETGCLPIITDDEVLQKMLSSIQGKEMLLSDLRFGEFQDALDCIKSLQDLAVEIAEIEDFVTAFGGEFPSPGYYTLMFRANMLEDFLGCFVPLDDQSQQDQYDWESWCRVNFAVVDE